MLDTTDKDNADKMQSLISSLPEKRDNITKEISEHLDNLKSKDTENGTTTNIDNVTLDIS